MKEIVLIGTLALMSLIILMVLLIIWSSDPWGISWHQHRCKCHEQKRARVYSGKGNMVMPSLNEDDLKEYMMKIVRLEPTLVMVYISEVPRF